MFGKPGGDPTALRPLTGVHFELVPKPGGVPGEGELVLLGNASATSGYLPILSETRKYRSLTGDDRFTPQQRF
jgi:hypothetical protein